MPPASSGQECSLHTIKGSASLRWSSYDFNVWTTRKRVEKLRYMDRNPVTRGLVGAPEEWGWSSYRFYLSGEAGPVRVNEGWTKISFRDRVA